MDEFALSKTGRTVILGSKNSQEIKLRQFEDDRLANLNYVRSTDTITFLQHRKEKVFLLSAFSGHGKPHARKKTSFESVSW